MQQSIRSEIPPRSAAANSMGSVDALWRAGLAIVFVVAMCWASSAIVSASPDPEGMADAMSVD